VKEPIKSQISPDGLRYVAKSQGTDFPGGFGATMSCFRCGRHRPRSQMASFSIAGTRQLRCKEGC
jgi:hypothetical protein